MTEVRRAMRLPGLMARIAAAMGPRTLILENSTEELDDAVSKGKKPKLFGFGDGPFAGQAGQGGVLGRLEENYLYSTRRFPNNTANNTIGSGAVTAGDYPFFTNGVGDQGSTAGYFSLSNLTYQQTNMAPSGKIPTGRGFKLYDLAVSFNAGAIGSDIAQLLDTCNLRFQKQAGQLVVQHGPIILWPGGVGLSGYAATTATTTTLQAATSGAPNLTNARRSRNPRILSANDDFSYIVNAAAATPNSNTTVALSAFLEMRIWLWGFVLDKIPN